MTPTRPALIGRFLAIADAPAAALDAVARLAGAGGRKLEAALKGWARRLAALTDEGAPADAAALLHRASAATSATTTACCSRCAAPRSATHRPVAAGGRYDSLFGRLGASLACGAVGCMVRPGRAWKEGAQ